MQWQVITIGVLETPLEVKQLKEVIMLTMPERA
jgi:hypothetical protein